MQQETLRKLAERQELSPDEIEAFIGAVDRDAVGDAAIAAVLLEYRGFG